MGTYNIHAGHAPSNSGAASGAVGILNESNEARKVKDQVIFSLRSNGHTVYDCTCNQGLTQNGVLKDIVSKCNYHSVDLDISIHFNAGGGKGVEVWCYDNGTSAVASRICNAIASLGFANRGVKYSRQLYVLNNTKSPAILIECCFVDSQTDASLYNVGKMANAIASGILGMNVATQTVQPQVTSQPQKTTPSSNKQVNVFYNVFTNKWLGEVRNLDDYAGWKEVSIKNVAIRVSDGSVKYRVHVKGGSWLSYVTGYNTNDGNNGYAGNGKEIDAIEVIYYTPNNIRPYKYAKYRVAPCNSNYYPWQLDNNNGPGQDGYAGGLGKSIGKFQIIIE